MAAFPFQLDAGEQLLGTPAPLHPDVTAAASELRGGKMRHREFFGALFPVIQKQPLSETLSKIVPAAAAAACFKGRGESGDSFCNVPFSEVSVLGIPRAAVAAEQAAARGGDEER